MAANGLLIDLETYYKMETIPTTPIPDESGNGNDLGALAGTVWSNVSGKKDLSLSQGTDTGNRAGIPKASSPFHFGDVSFTTNFWVAGPTATWTAPDVDIHMGVWDDVGQDDRSWVCYWAPADPHFVISVSSDGTAGTQTNMGLGPHAVPPDNTFVMVTVGYDADTNVIFGQFNNGTRVTLAHSGGMYAASLADFTFANANAFGTQPRMGAYNYDEVGIWKRALSTSDVSNLFGGLFFDDFDSGEAGAEEDSRYYHYRRRAG